MKEKFSTEDLIHSLPDYITNRISNLNLKTEIENELDSNPDFLREYSQLRSTLGFLNSNNLKSPSESYFNNLSVKINDKINRPDTYGNFWQRLSLIWKVLLPVIPAIIIAVVLIGNLQEGKMNQRLSEDKKNKTEVADEKINSNENRKEIENTKPGIKPDESKSAPDEMNKSENSTVILKRTDKKKGTVQSSDKNLVDILDKNENEVKNTPAVEEDMSSNPLLSNNFEILEEEAADNEEDVLYSDDDIEVENLEEEFINLSPEEQQEIINNLYKTQI